MKIRFSRIGFPFTPLKNLSLRIMWQKCILTIKDTNHSRPRNANRKKKKSRRIRARRKKTHIFTCNDPNEKIYYHMYIVTLNTTREISKKREEEERKFNFPLSPKSECAHRPRGKTYFLIVIFDVKNE